MFKGFFAALLIEIVKFLKENSDFYENSAKKKTESLENLRIPSSIKTYLTEGNLEELLSDIKNLIDFINFGKKIDIRKNGLLKAISKFLGTKFANDLYSIPTEFFELNYDDQKTAITKIIKSETALAHALREILINNTSQEIYEEINFLVRTTHESPYLLIQTAREIDGEAKKDIRDHLHTKFDKVIFPVFQINKDLYGGMRIFIDGKVADMSWLKKVNLITKL